MIDLQCWLFVILFAAAIPVNVPVKKHN